MTNISSPFLSKNLRQTPGSAPLRLVSDVLPIFYAERTAKGLAKSTMDASALAITRFVTKVPTLDMTWGEIEAYVTSMRDSGYRDTTIDLHLTHIRTFVKWCVQGGYMPVDLFKYNRLKNSPKPSGIEARATSFSSHEIARMRQACDDIERFGGKYHSGEFMFEVRLVFLLALTTGMRLAEISVIRLSDFEVRDTVWWLRIPKAKWSEYGRNIRMERETTFVLIDYVNATQAKRDSTIARDTGITDYLFVAGTRVAARSRLLSRLNQVIQTAQVTHDDRGRRRQVFHAFRRLAISTAAQHGARAGEIKAAYGVGALTAHKSYIDPVVNQRMDSASAAADELSRIAKTDVTSYESNIWTPFAGDRERTAFDVD